MNKICENIKRLRLEKKLTQQDVAEKIYVTRQCISRWEQGITLPDLNSIERLSNVFECNVNDIIDNESIKAITINEAIKNKKNKKIILISIITSLFAILISITALYFLNKQKNNVEINYIKAIVLEINSDRSELKLRLDERNLDNDQSNIFTFNPWGIQELKLYDNKQKEITVNDLKLGDIIEISYYDEINTKNIYEIHLIDSEVEKNFYGVIIVTNGERYKTYEEIPMEQPLGIEYYLYKTRWGSSEEYWSVIPEEASSSFSYEKYNNNIVFAKHVFNMNVYFDELKLGEDPVIGLVYSTGIEYVETLSRNLNTNRHYEGELSYEVPDDEFLIHSENVEYNINFFTEFSFSKIEVYEYNMNHGLIGVTELYDWDDIRVFLANKDALYSYFKVFSEVNYGYGAGTFETFETYYLKIGDDLNVYLSDNYGLISKCKIDYRYIRYINS